ncbi:hypothetical protein PENSPDRAFT_731514 [Peniophora sp. CONT]|nr:hypothetical protein PENSPDRAFT_731514 [Peniophora sp. CONT]
MEEAPRLSIPHPCSEGASRLTACAALHLSLSANITTLALRTFPLGIPPPLFCATLVFVTAVYAAGGRARRTLRENNARPDASRIRTSYSPSSAARSLLHRPTYTNPLPRSSLLILRPNVPADRRSQKEHPALARQKGADRVGSPTEGGLLGVRRDRRSVKSGGAHLREREDANPSVYTQEAAYPGGELHSAPERRRMKVTASRARYCSSIVTPLGSKTNILLTHWLASHCARRNIASYPMRQKRGPMNSEYAPLALLALYLRNNPTTRPWHKEDVFAEPQASTNARSKHTMRHNSNVLSMKAAVVDIKTGHDQTHSQPHLVSYMRAMSIEK